MFKYKRIILKLLIITSLVSISQIYFVFANPLDSWENPKAYKPKPVLFLHGFAKGKPSGWNDTKAVLNGYFSKYQPLGFYLETIDFQDSNGSIDRYPPGKFNPQGNPAGWADKVKNKVDELLDTVKYGSYTNKLNLICHSMGGLAARWYLTNYSSNSVDKLILIGVPNLGTDWASLANAASKVPKVGWLQLLTINGFASKSRDVLTFALDNLIDIDIYGEAVADMDPSPTTGSGFINSLNSLPQPQNISYYGIIGIVGSFMNRYIADGDYYGGDCIVSKTSQLGIGNVSYKEWLQINANHWQEIKVAGEGTFSSVLYILDSTTPELEIISPDPTITTEIHETSIHIQGKVLKEYLPADSQLIMNIVRQDDNYALPAQISYLQPSDLWIPNNPDSPVAEFDELINFPGNGTYKISCQVKNPAGLSDIKDVWVKVGAVVNANIIVHCHNPEGKEIASIQMMSQNSVEIYDGDTLIGYGAYNAETHNKPIAISSDTHTIKAKFNGITLEQEIDIDVNETQILTFVLERTIGSLLNNLSSYSRSYECAFSGSFDGYYPDTWVEDEVIGCGTSCRFGDSLPTQAGTFDEIARQTIILTEDTIYCYKYAWELIKFTKGNPWEGGHPYNHARARSVISCNLNYTNSSFLNWYIQTMGEQGTININTNKGNYNFFLGYTLNSINAQNLYIYSFNINPSMIQAGYPGYIQGTPIEAITTFSVFKMSSVPYDLLGTAV